MQTDNPTLETFQVLLNKNALNFYPARTAKSLMTHWNLMKQYMLLPDQIVNNTKNPKLFSSLPDGDVNINFSDQEEKINDSDLTEPRDEALELELALADRKHKKEIRHLENELPRWTVLVDSITGIGNHPEFDNQTLAVLRGRLVRYLMRSREVSIILVRTKVVANSDFCDLKTPNRILFFSLQDHFGTKSKT